ncbi:hypothetical protein [Streptomyces parvus]|nr:hypothetical protein [Streptomyces parvus]
MADDQQVVHVRRQEGNTNGARVWELSREHGARDKDGSVVVFPALPA